MTDTVHLETQTLRVTSRSTPEGFYELALIRPDLFNRFDHALHADFLAALHLLHGCDNARVVLFTSSGKVFSAGGDFDFMMQIHADEGFRQSILKEGKELVMKLIDLPVPVVIALHGDALGLGATVVLGCDAIVAARTARIGDPHVVMGLVAGDGGCLMWPQAMGMIRARRHLLTGDPLSAEEAFAMGLVTDLVDEPQDVGPAAAALAARIAALPPLAVRGTKRALGALTRARAEEVFDLSIELEGQTAVSDDLLEAIAAFKERRPGKYQGR